MVDIFSAEQTKNKEIEEDQKHRGNDVSIFKT